ncbi:MAG: hypothetical protein ACM3KM_00240 [Acidobacteriaceae bacterium]
MDQQFQSPVPPVQPSQPVAPKPKRTGMIIGTIIGVLVVALLVVIAYMLMGKNTREGAEVTRDNANEIREGANDLRDQVSGNQPNSNPGTSNQNTQPSSATAAPTNPAPAPTGPVLADYAGNWNGSYAYNQVTGAACEASGPASFSVNSTGAVTGYATIKGVKIPGTGTIDKAGSIKGTWNYTGAVLSYSGKFNASTNAGSGTYRNSFGCSGTWSVTR